MVEVRRRQPAHPLSLLGLYLFSAVVGSVVCTNALCFEAQRVRDDISHGERMWRILVAKNLAMAVLVTIAALPVIGFLTVTNEGNPIAMVDQLVTMVFIWLGVGNVLSVLYPLRHEPITARLMDGTWKPYLFSFALSYGVGLTVNLMIFRRLWSRQTAATELVGGQWAAFVLVLASAITSWVLLSGLRPRAPNSSGPVTRGGRLPRQLTRAGCYPLTSSTR